MTDKEKIKTLFLKYIQDNLTDKKPEEIMNNLKPMYVLLQEAGLKPEGLTFEKFNAIAQLQYQFNLLKDKLNG